MTDFSKMIATTELDLDIRPVIFMSKYEKIVNRLGRLILCKTGSILTITTFQPLTTVLDYLSEFLKWHNEPPHTIILKEVISIPENEGVGYKNIFEKM